MNVVSHQTRTIREMVSGSEVAKLFVMGVLENLLRVTEFVIELEGPLGV